MPPLSSALALPNALAPAGVNRVKWFVFRHFERLLVVLLVASMLVIHAYIDHKIAFLSFYYLPIIVGGFYLGRHAAVWSSVLVVGLVVFFQLVVGLDGEPGLTVASALALAPWGGFLILTAHTVGRLAEQRESRTRALRDAYVSLLEILTFHLASSERHQRGHSNRVSKLAVAIAGELGVPAQETETLRVAALLHELAFDDPQLSRAVSQFSHATTDGLPPVDTLQGAMALLDEYRQYNEHVALEWPADRIRVSVAAKVLAVADAYESLQMPTPSRPAFAPWSALEEIEKGAGQAFASDIVRTLRRVATMPERRDSDQKLTVLA
jgi:hypothetical protein